VEKEDEDVNQDDSRSAKRLAWILNLPALHTHKEVANIMNLLAVCELLNRAENRNHRGCSSLLDIAVFNNVHVSNCFQPKHLVYSRVNQ
jgi:hypothetical protein